MKRTCMLMLLIARVAVSRETAATIAGSILGADGAPAVRADVLVIPFDPAAPTISARADARGAFHLRVHAPAAYRIVFAALGRRAYETPIIVAHAGTISVNARLASYDVRDAFDSVRVIGDFNRFAFGTARLMQRRSDGTFALDVASTNDTLSYQLVGVARDGRSINGTMPGDAVPDNEGDYRSVVRTHDGHATIVFDPRALPRAAGTQLIAWRPRAVERWTRLYQWTLERKADYRHATVTAPGNIDTMQAAAQRGLRVIDSALESEHDPAARGLLLMTHIEFGLPGVLAHRAIADTAIVTRAFDEIAPTSPLWEISPGLVIAGAAELGLSANARAYIDAVLARHASPDVKAQALFNAVQFARVQHAADGGAAYYDRLVTEYPATSWAHTARQSYAPDRRIMAGKRAPAFTVSALEDSSDVYSNGTFAGKFVLVDFWATWCGPCVGEMEDLHKAYAAFKNRNFEILSLSLDPARRAVAAFRAKKWPMPWRHGFVEGAFASAIADSFEVRGIPKPVLIGPDGNILATDLDLRGSALAATLDKLLPPAR